jgi:hypothetical protein
MVLLSQLHESLRILQIILSNLDERGSGLRLFLLSYLVL